MKTKNIYDEIKKIFIYKGDLIESLRSDAEFHAFYLTKKHELQSQIQDQVSRGFTKLVFVDFKNSIIYTLWYPEHQFLQREYKGEKAYWARKFGAASTGISIMAYSQDDIPVVIRRSSKNTLGQKQIAPIAGHFKDRCPLKEKGKYILKDLISEMIVSEIKQELGSVEQYIDVNWDSIELLDVVNPVVQQEISVVVKIKLPFDQIKRINQNLDFSDTTEIAEKIAHFKNYQELKNMVEKQENMAEQHRHTILRKL